MKRTRVTALVLAACMVGALLTGCGGEKTSSAAPEDTKAATSAAAPAAEERQKATASPIAKTVCKRNRKKSKGDFRS